MSGFWLNEWLLQTTLITSSCISTIANLLVIFVFARRPGLRTVSNRFVINLLIANVLSSVVLIPLLLIDESTRITSQGLSDDPLALDLEKPLTVNANLSGTLHQPDIPILDKRSERDNTSNTRVERNRNNKKRESINEREFIQNGSYAATSINATSDLEPDPFKIKLFDQTSISTVAAFFCYMADGSATLICTASILSILLISIDQYLAVVHPLRYHMRIDHFRSSILIVATWVVSFIFGVLSALIPNNGLWNVCSNHERITFIVNTEISDLVRMFYGIFYFTFMIFFPFVTICCIYMQIYTAAHKNSERMRHTNSGSITINIESYVPIPIIENDLNRREIKGGLVFKMNKSLSTDTLKQPMETLGRLTIIPEHMLRFSSLPATPKAVKKIKSVPDFSTIAEIDPYRFTKTPSVETMTKHLTNKSYSGMLEQFRCGPKASVDFRGSNDFTPIGTPKHRTNSIKSTSSFMSTLKCRISNASMFKYREETRAAKISAIVIFLVLFGYIPFGVNLILHTTVVDSRSLRFFDSIALVHLICSSVLSPFLFAYRNRRIRKELKRLFQTQDAMDVSKISRLKNFFRRNFSRGKCRNVPKLAVDSAQCEDKSREHESSSIASFHGNVSAPTDT